jgi:ribose transport system substrate-binding protein
MAARRGVGWPDGHGTVALLGINPDIIGIMIRALAFEQFLAANYPDIRIVEKRMGTFNEAHEQQVAEDTLNANPNLDVIVGLMWSTVDGTLSALNTSRVSRSVKIIGFDPFGLPPFQKENFDSAIQQNTRSMGEQAIESICARRLGKSVPGVIYVQPRLINRQNVDSPEIRRITTGDWKLGHWNWSPAQ